ncbi:MAG TPA: L-2-hydroxyglutarate oxidase [Thermoplasmata archaeon]|nr:L-2-hydroxyglutarate oxidase [Thermoplasmata archaeon]
MTSRLRDERTAPRIGIIGAGLVGLATARSISIWPARPEVLVFEAEPEVARHQSSHNSGVVHSGVNYVPGSLKARLCRQGRAELLRFIESHHVPYRETGKLVVAPTSAEIATLDEIQHRAALNGVEATRLATPEEIHDIEPSCGGLEALHVPSTGFVDYAVVARALARDIESEGGRIMLEWPVVGAERTAHGFRLTNGREAETVDLAIACTGVESDRMAHLFGFDPGVRIIPFRGEFFRFRETAGTHVRSAIYRTPNLRLPFAGIHFTRRISQEVFVGPNAVLAFARDGYRRGQVRLRDLAESAGYPGFWRMAREHWRIALGEEWQSRVRPVMVDVARALVPKVGERDFEREGSGVRARAVAQNGKLLDDFLVRFEGRSVHVLNAPSPAATSCLALGREIAELARERLGPAAGGPMAAS